jgi:hypothetical protein
MVLSNSLAYHDAAAIAAVKSFIVQATDDLKNYPIFGKSSQNSN